MLDEMQQFAQSNIRQPVGHAAYRRIRIAARHANRRVVITPIDLFIYFR